MIPKEESKLIAAKNATAKNERHKGKAVDGDIGLCPLSTAAFPLAKRVSPALLDLSALFFGKT